jgi:hypothetical protein
MGESPRKDTDSIEDHRYPIGRSANALEPADPGKIETWMRESPLVPKFDAGRGSGDLRRTRQFQL